MRYVIALTLLLAGCNETVSDYRPLCSAAIGVGTQVKATPVTPAGDKCQNCNGTGKVGDGTIMVKCAVCGGTGKTK